MIRILKTGVFPEKPEISGDDVLVITPHRAASSSIGREYCSLPRLAREILRDRRGLTVAPNIVARHTLKRVIARELPKCDPAAISSRIREILETVLRVGIDVDVLLERGSPRVRELARITNVYQEELKGAGYIDRAELLWAAAHCGPDRQKILVYGHHRARKEEILFIDAIAGEGSVFYLPCGEDSIFTTNREWRDALASFGWQIDDASNNTVSAGEKLASGFVGLPASGSGSKAFAYSNIESEVRGVLSNAKQMISDGADPYSIAILCRDQDTYAPVIADVSAEYGLPVQITYETNLSNTVFGGFVSLMLDAASQDFGYEATARFLMHPFGPGIADGIWTKARLAHAFGIDGWARIGVDLSPQRWPERQSLNAWISNIKDAFDLFDTLRKAAASAREVLAFNKFLDSMAAFESLEGGRNMTYAEFAVLASEILADETVPFAPAEGGVSLFEPNSILGARYDHLFVLGMNEGVFPAPATENPVIDFHERKRLHDFGIEFEGAADVARWEELSFYFTLLTAQRSASFSYPITVDNGERVPSAFFARLGIEPVRVPVEPPIVSSIEEQRTALLRSGNTPADDGVIESARARFAIELARENSPDFDEFDGVIGVAIDPSKRTWSASQLTTIGQCAFRWFAQRILRLDPVDEVEIGLDYTKRGTFYHRVLEIAVGKAREETDIRGSTLKHLEAAFAEAETDPEVALPSIVNWEVQRREHIKALRKAVEAEAFIAEGSKVLGLEQKFDEVWQGFPLVGYIDRVDETPDGLIAIDYKTSSAAPKGAKDETGKLSVDVQIPLYSNVALRKLHPEGQLGNSIYYSLVKGKVLRAERDEDLEKLEGLAARIKQTLAAGNFAVDPDAEEHACSYCRYDHVCRKGPRLERKRVEQ